MSKKTLGSSTATKKMPRITIEVSVKLHKLFKAKTAAEGKTIKDAVCGLIEKYVNEGKNGKHHNF